MAQITVKTPYGTMGLIDEDKLQAALKVGYSIPSNDEITAHNNAITYGSPSQSLGAYAEEALGTATFGLSRELENYLGLTTPEEQAGRAEANPTSRAAGMATGVIAPLVAAPESMLAKLPVGQVAKTGARVTRALTPAVAENAGLAARVLAKAAPAAAGSAVEGAFYGLGQSVTEHALGDPNVNAEKVISNIGYSSLLGGALGGTLGTAEVIVPPAVVAAKNSSNKLLGKIFGETGEVGPLGQAYAKTSAFISGKPEESILEALKHRSSLIESHEAREHLAGEFADGLQEHLDDVGAALKRANQQIRPEEISNSLEALPVLAAKEEGTKIFNRLHDTIEHMEAHPALFPAMVPAKLRQLSLEYVDQSLGATGSHQVYNAINELKRNIDDQFGLFNKAITPEWKDAANQLKSLRGDIKDNLENEVFWGKAAGRQAAFNDAQSAFIYSTKKGGDFAKAFLVPIKGRTGAVIQQISPSKVKTFFRQINDLQGQEKAAALESFVGNSRKLVDEIETSYKNAPGREFDKQAVHDVITKNYATAQKAMRQAELHKELGLLHAGGHNAYISEVGAGVATGAGHAIMGPAIEAFTLARNPGLAIQRLAHIEKMVSQTTAFINRASKKLFKITTQGGKKVSGFLGSKLAPDSKKKQQEEAIAALRVLDSDPMRMVEHFSEMTAGISDEAPETTQAIHETATRATQFLLSKVPVTQAHGPLETPNEPSQSELAEFQRYYDIVDDPLTIFDHLNDGTLLFEHMEALTQVYPQLYSEISQSLMTEMASTLAKKSPEEIPYSKRIALSLFLDQDLHSSVSQEAIASNQMVLSQGSRQNNEDVAQPQPQARGLEKMSIASQSMTPLQRSNQRNLV